jgi:molybdopterin-guanine dinucleotide biosynthesis protein A
VILAGGRGRRLGGADKAFVSLAGRPLIAIAVARLQPQVATLAINANGDAARFAAWGLPVLADTVPDFAGPLAGMLAGLRWARGVGADRLATVAVDTPFFPHDLVARLATVARGEAIAVASSGGRRHQVFTLIPVALADDLEAFLHHGTSLKVADWLARHAIVEAPFAASDTGGIDPFFNINTEAERLAAETKTLARPLQGPSEK